jgi:NAD-reducing hydrogenase large subunit
VQGVMMRKFGQEVIKATAGKKIHGTGAIPGGVNKNLRSPSATRSSRTSTRCSSGRGRAQDGQGLHGVEHLEELSAISASFDSNHLSLIRADGAMDLYHGNLRAIDATGETIFDQVDYQGYLEYIAEEVRPWSYMKFPFIKSSGPRRLVSRRPAGPREHLRLHRHPEAEAARKEFMEVTDGQAQQHDDGVSLGADDRGAALDGEDQGAAQRPGSAGHRPGVKGERRTRRSG